MKTLLFASVTSFGVYLMFRRSLLSILFIGILVSFSAHSGDVKNGEKLYASCIQCHGDRGLGVPEQKAPRISGQHARYIETQLNAFKSKKRKNPKMYPFIKNLSDKDYKDLAAFVSQLM